MPPSEGGNSSEVVGNSPEEVGLLKKEFEVNRLLKFAELGTLPQEIGHSLKKDRRWNRAKGRR